MFPNPQSALPLPPRPSIERYKKLAKELVRAYRSGEDGAVRHWADDWVGGLPSTEFGSPVEEIAEFARRKLAEAGGARVTKAQFVIARSHGFQSWVKFSRHLEGLAEKTSAVARFEAAADAIVNGDVAKLKRLLRAEPKLIRMRSAREHGATLLHYVAANGVENYRQKTPKNILEIAEILLDAGAEIDATADVYGGGCTTLGLAATSVHPERAGVQEDLLRALLHHGATLEVKGAGNGQSMVVACLANGRGKAAEFLAGRGAPIDSTAAAGLGLLSVVEKDYAGTVDLAGFLYACAYGRNEVVEFFVKKGADLAAHRGDGQTALHWAVIGGHLDTVKLLLRHKPQLEARNVYGGTVLGQARWSKEHSDRPEIYEPIIEALKAADIGDA